MNIFIPHFQMEDEADEPIKEQSEDFSSLNQSFVSVFTYYKSALQQIMVAPLVPCYNPQNFINFTTLNPSLYLQYLSHQLFANP